MTDSAMQWAVERERELRKWSYLEYRVRDIGLQEAGVPRFDETRGPTTSWDCSGYDLSDPKHPRFHSVHSDLWDVYREGK